MNLTKANCVIGKRYNIDGEYRYCAEGPEGWQDSTPLCQFTTCGKCKTKLIGWSKWAECPKCKKICYLT